jgi:hypothetical protein
MAMMLHRGVGRLYFIISGYSVQEFSSIGCKNHI